MKEMKKKLIRMFTEELQYQDCKPYIFLLTCVDGTRVETGVSTESTLVVRVHIDSIGIVSINVDGNKDYLYIGKNMDHILEILGLFTHDAYCRKLMEGKTKEYNCLIREGFNKEHKGEHVYTKYDESCDTLFRVTLGARTYRTCGLELQLLRIRIIAQDNINDPDTSKYIQYDDYVHFPNNDTLLMSVITHDINHCRSILKISPPTSNLKYVYGRIAYKNHRVQPHYQQEVMEIEPLLLSFEFYRRYANLNNVRITIKDINKQYGKVDAPLHYSIVDYTPNTMKVEVYKDGKRVESLFFLTIAQFIALLQDSNNVIIELKSRS